MYTVKTSCLLSVVLYLSYKLFDVQEMDEELLENYLGIIHNMAQSETTITTELRDHDFVELHLPFLKSSNDKVLLICLATLADLVDESQAKHLETGGEFFKFLLKFLKSAISDKHRRCKGWSARELARSKWIFFFRESIFIKFCREGKM